MGNEGGAMDSHSEKQILQALETMNSRLMNIESEVKSFIRLEEQVTQYAKNIERLFTRSESHENRLHESELWQAQHGDIPTDVKDVTKRVSDIEEDRHITKGRKDVESVVFKWVFGIIGAVLTYNMTGV